MHIIKFPSTLTIRYASAIIKRCEEAILSNEKDVIFDLSTCWFCDPFGVTLLTGAMMTCIAHKHSVKYRKPQSNKLDQYFQSIGFYDFGKSQIGSSKFVGRQVELKHLNALDPTYTDAVLGVLQNYLRMSPGVKNSLHLSINELMTNTFDHSKTVQGCFLSAQAYKGRGNISLCLTDFGKGILKILSTSSKYSYLSESVDAILLAIQEGVSSREGKVSGLGLTHIHRFLQVNNGEAHIISGDGWVHWNYADANAVKIKTKKLSVAFEGTIVNIIAKADGEGFYFLSSENPEELIF
jgi:hypothetical protein